MFKHNRVYIEIYRENTAHLHNFLPLDRTENEGQ